MMSFCGTLGRYDAKFLTLALHCCVMNDSLIKLADKEAKTIPEDRRTDFTQLAECLEYYTPENMAKKTGFREKRLAYEGYEWLMFFKDLRLERKVAVQMMKDVGLGGVPKDPHPLIEFLSSLNSIALSRHHQHSGGCF